MTDKFHAIKALCPEATFGVRNNEVVWRDEKIEQPTDKEINDKIAELQADYNAKKYQRDRLKEYNAIGLGEQLDMIYHDMDGWKKRIKSVKDKYPKPSE